MSDRAIWTALRRSQSVAIHAAFLSRTGDFDLEAVKAEGARLIAGLPAMDPVEIEKGRQAAARGRREMAPAGRPVRGRGGIVRWVA